RAATRRLSPGDGLRALLDAMTELVVVVSDETCVHANPAALHALGYAERDELVGRHASSIWAKAADLAASTAGAWREATLARKDGLPVSVEMATFPITLDDASCVAIL